MKAIISNYYLRLASININPITLDKFTFKTLNRIQQNSAFFLFLLKIVVGARNCYTI